MKAPVPFNKIKYLRNEQFFNIGLTSYTLSHHSFPRHFHEHYVIELVVDGADKFYCNGRTHTATSNELVFINPGEVHTGSTVSGRPLHYYSISPGLNELKQVSSILEKPITGDIYFQHLLSNQSQLANKMLLFFQAVESFSAENLQLEELFLDLMNDLICNTFCHVNEDFKTTIKDARILQAIDLLHASFTEPVSLRQMAEHVRISPFHLIRLFKSATGLSPYEYLLILRIEYAKKLLHNGHSVQDAASGAGFYDASHFNRLFKKISGSNPKIFRSSK